MKSGVQSIQARPSLVSSKQGHKTRVISVAYRMHGNSFLVLTPGLKTIGLAVLSLDRFSEAFRPTSLMIHR
ncbi:Secondary metabolism regulator LAE1 [Fusarium oxysporum f. sp. albedinis]|nr:Secondary metabolism regulator LAE1 [Fusarium oxysporum f. sp. albedinis]